MILVGFRVLNAKGKEAKLEEAIRKWCILGHPDIAHDIAYKTKNACVYANGLTEAIISAFAFSAEPIYAVTPQILIVSTVNFILEFNFREELIRLAPTEFLTGVPQDARTPVIRSLVEQGCLRLFGLDEASGWTLIGDYFWDFSDDFLTARE